MEAIEAILSRRSIRRYTKSPVPQAIADKVLECGFAAPSARNRRPLRFVLINDSDKLMRLSLVHQYTTMVKEAAFAILVCGDSNKEDRRQFLDQDGAAAAQNMLVAANALGLGGVWCGIVAGGESEIKVRALLGLPAHVYPLALLAFGMPDERKAPYEGIEPDAMHINGWQG